MDKDKQREQTRLRVERYRKKAQALPIDVQRTIERISDSPEEIKQRTAIALQYQKNHPGSRHTGIDYDAEPRSTAKPGDEDYTPHDGPDEYCDECDITLLRLEQQRQHPGTCLTCVMKETV